MKKSSLILCLLWLCNVAFAQEKNFRVLGKVVDSASLLPLNGASVYCENTTHGTITNEEGLFFMRLPNGGYDLVVTFTGYVKQVIRLSSTWQAEDTLTIALAKADQTLSEVAVVASTEDPNGLEKYGSFFMDHFIGTTPNAAHCRIENPEALHFYFSKKRNRLKVTAHEDLLVANYALGYTIRYQLDSFSYDYNTHISQYTGSPFYIEMDSTAEMVTQWKKNRARTYLGSRLHFMRAMYDSIVREEGFIVEKLLDSSDSYEGAILTNLYNDSTYIADSSDVTINWTGRYRISYRNVYPDKRFLQVYGLPADTRMQVTLIESPNGFIIEQNGYFYEQYDVINTGYWAWKKLAEQLPYNYDYE